MGRRCSVCTHIDRKSIDSALVADNGSFRSIAKQHGLKPNAIMRHRDAHLGPRLARTQAAREARDEATASSVLDQMADLQERTLAALERAEKAKAKPSEIARVVREVRENALATARLTGLLKDGSVVNVDARTQVAILAGLPAPIVEALQDENVAFRFARLLSDPAMLAATVERAKALPPGL